MKRKILSFSISLSLLLLSSHLHAAEPQEDLEAFDKMFGQGPQEEDVFRTDRLLVTATGSLKPIFKAPSVASVITAEDIEEIGALTLDDVLETVPGLHVIPSSYNRMNSTYSIRGIHTGENPQVLMLLDGVPLTYFPKGNRVNTFTMSVTNISRVEIIRGPGSAIHGADAFAGTINVITKDRHEIDGTTTGIRAGSFGTTDTWIQHGNTYGGWDIAISLDYYRHDGDTGQTVDADLQTTLDAALNNPFGLDSASLAPGPMETDDKIFDGHLSMQKGNWNIKFWGWLQDDGGEGFGVANGLDPNGGEDVDIFLADISYKTKDLAKDWDLELRLSHFFVKSESFLYLLPDGTLVPIGSDGNADFASPSGLALFTDGYIGDPSSTNIADDLDLTAFYTGINQHRLLFGVGFKYLDMDTSESKNFGPGVLDSTNIDWSTVGPYLIVDGTLTDVSDTNYIYMEDAHREIWYALFQDEWAIARHWELTAGVRYDHYSDFGGTINPRLALVWETRYDLTTKLLYGRAFRPPSFADNYLINNPAGLGNPELEPETIDTYELAFDFQPTNRLRTIFNIFYYEIEDLIEAVADAGQTTSTAQNEKDQDGYGFEIETNWEATDNIRIRSNFAYQRSKDHDSDEIVPEAPELQFYANLHWKFAQEWSLDSQYYWIADRHRADGDSRDDIKDYDYVNLTLRRKNIADHLDLAVIVQNIFDEDLREPGSATMADDLPLEGQAVYGELRYTF